MDWRLVCLLVVLAAGCLANAAPSNNETTSDLTDKPSNNGLGGLYSMTRTFIDLVMTKKSVIGALNDQAGKNFFQGNLTSSEKSSAIQKVAKSTFIGYAICIAIGIIFIIVMPLVGCCFGCCRCCGHCGGTPRDAEKGPDRLKKTCFSIFFVIIVAFMLGSVVCIFLNNEMIHDQTSKKSENSIIQVAVKNLNRTETYINKVVEEFSDVVMGGFNTLVDNVVQTLKETATTAKENLAKVTNADDALDKAKKLAEKLKEVKESLTEVNKTTTDLQVGTADLGLRLGAVSANLTSTLNGCNDPACTDVLNVSKSALSLGANFSQVDNVADELTTVLDVDWEQLEANIDEGKKAVENITDDIKNITDSATKDIQDKIDNGTRESIAKEVTDGKEEIKKIVNFDKYREQMNDQKGDVDTYGNYIYWAGLALGCITLLVVLLYFLGLLFVTCCGRDGSSCNQRTGTNFLMAGVGFTFIFAMFLMLLTLLLFIVGAPLHSMICRHVGNLSDPEKTKEFDKFLDAMKVNYNNLTLSTAMAKCGRNESIYNAANLGDTIHIVEALNISKYPDVTNAIDDLKTQTFDIGNVTILSNDTKNKLNSLISGNLDNIDFASFNAQVNKDLTGGDLTKLIELISIAETMMRANDTDKADMLKAQANELDKIQTQTMPGLEQKKEKLGKAIDNLKKTLKDDDGFTNVTTRLLNSLHDAENNITTKGNAELTKIVAELAEDVLTKISEGLMALASKLTNDVGRCKEPLDIVQSTIDIGCVSVLGPFNALWFSLGWFIFFSIPGLIFAVKLVGVFLAKKVDNDDNKSFDQGRNDEYFGGGGATNTRNNPQSGGHANQGYQSDNYSNDKHQRSSRHRREHRQHHEHQHRQPDYNSQQRSPQHYDNRGGHW